MNRGRISSTSLPSGSGGSVPGGKRFMSTTCNVYNEEVKTKLDLVSVVIKPYSDNGRGSYLVRIIDIPSLPSEKGGALVHQAKALPLFRPEKGFRNIGGSGLKNNGVSCYKVNSILDICSEKAKGGKENILYVLNYLRAAIISASKLGLIIIIIILPTLNLISLNTSSLLRSFIIKLRVKELVTFNKSPLYYRSSLLKNNHILCRGAGAGRAYYSTESSNSLVNENNILIAASYDNIDLAEVRKQIFSDNKGKSGVYR